MSATFTRWKSQVRIPLYPLDFTKGSLPTNLGQMWLLRQDNAVFSHFLLVRALR
jgi:hypothetical protein